MDKNSNKLSFSLDCLVCNNRFDRESLNMVEQNDSKLIFHASCPKCQSSALLVLSNSSENEAITGIGMLTDLSSQEARGLFKAEAISADEVIEVYKKMYHA